MGVLACSRNGCEGVMCGTLIGGSYICEDCKDEFRKLVGDGYLRKADMVSKFREFKETQRTCKEPDKPVNVDDFFSNPEFEYDA